MNAIVRRVETAAVIGLEEARFLHRAVPCICPRQFETNPPVGLSMGVSFSRDGSSVERVKCSDCGKRWKRIER